MQLERKKNSLELGKGLGKVALAVLLVEGQFDVEGSPHWCFYRRSSGGSYSFG